MTVTAITAAPSKDRAIIDNPSPTVLRQLGFSKKRWASLTDAERLEAMVKRIERDQAKAAALRGMPQEPPHVPGQDAPVVHFTKTYGGESHYEFAAIHVRGRGWIITSQQRLGHISWTRLLQFAMLREEVDFDPQFYVVSGWTALEKSK